MNKMDRTHTVALASGDGIGPEISWATREVLAASGARIHWVETPVGKAALDSHGEELPAASLERMCQIGVVLKSPLIAERRSGGVTVLRAGTQRHYPSVNNALRRELGAYVNVRPVRGWRGISGPHAETDLVIMREVTEDTYAGIERQIDPGRAEATKLITRAACERVARYACDYALAAGRRTVSAIHKANVLHLTDGLFLESVRSVTASYPTLVFDDKMVDAASYLLVKQPTLFDVMVLPNQYGDILSDLAAALVGSLGLAPGSNIGPNVAMFEAAHGAAPDLAGLDAANPTALILSGAMMLDHLGERECASRVRTAVAAVLEEGQCLTRDLGGRATLRHFTDTVCAAATTLV
jgi:isocitrate dehydrogenase (NAD+)